MNKEIERKFRLTREQAQKVRIIDGAEMTSLHEINQFYLKKETSVEVRIVSGDEPMWVISRGEHQLQLPMPIKAYEKLSEVLCELIDGDVSVLDNSAIRIRFKEDADTNIEKIIFTFKYRDEGSDYPYEFEVEIEDKELALEIVRGIPEHVGKFRKTYRVGQLDFELDIITGFDFIILEIEFKSEEDAKAFVLPIEHDGEVTGIPQYSNDHFATVIGDYRRKKAE